MLFRSSESRGNREQEISAISRAIKGIAKELNVPILALSQLSRAVETRGGDKRPQLSDLRESGAIEQDADMVMFIYRPEYYNILQDEEGNTTKGLGELIIAKNRNGSTEDVRVKFENHLAKFVNWDQQAFGLGDESNVQIDDQYGRQILKSENWDTADEHEDEPPF